MAYLTKCWNYLKSPGPMAVAALFGTLFAIYATFFYEKRGDLVVAVKSLSRVFDVHQSVGGLQISYAGEDLRVSKKTLWVMNLSISNVGNAEIRKGDYDDDAPIGVQIEGADLVDAPVVKASNDYLTKNLRLKTDKSSVLLSPVILEPQDSVSIDLLLLGSESTKPSLQPVGKIAGLKSIQLQTPDEVERKSFGSLIFDTDLPWVYPVRLVVYFISTILGAVLLAGLVSVITSPFYKIGDSRDNAKRKRLVSKFLRQAGLRDDLKVLAELYVDYGENSLLELKSLISRLEKRRALNERLPNAFDDNEAAMIAMKLEPISGWLVKELEEVGLLKFEEWKPVYPQTLKEDLVTLASYLKIDLNKEAKLKSKTALEVTIKSL